MFYGARWKSHECPTRELSIPEVLPCLSDENKIVPTQIPSLYAFLTPAPSLDVHSASCYLNFYAFYETPGCTWRLIHVDKCFECLNQSSVLSLKMTKNLQSHRHDENLWVQTSWCSSAQISSSMKKSTLMIFSCISMKKPLIEVGKLEGMLVKSCWCG